MAKSGYGALGALRFRRLCRQTAGNTPTLCEALADLLYPTASSRTPLRQAEGEDGQGSHGNNEIAVWRGTCLDRNPTTAAGSRESADGQYLPCGIHPVALWRNCLALYAAARKEKPCRGRPWAWIAAGSVSVYGEIPLTVRERHRRLQGSPQQKPHRDGRSEQIPYLSARGEAVSSGAFSLSHKCLFLFGSTQTHSAIRSQKRNKILKILPNCVLFLIILKGYTCPIARIERTLL